MSTCFGYIRVSTAKQGTHGVSLIEQKAAIERYAGHTGITITEWFEERETAAKRGRPVFSRMLGLLRSKKASGVVIHKIDRSARNLKDWADLGELIDAGVQVHFAADSLDLASRGGRLSADIQAVVAADYIRNLREEAKKGIYGRLKQGFYPLPAPVGYLDQGAAKVKEPDPSSASLIRRAFELYATGNYSLRTLVPVLHDLGLRTRRGGQLSINALATILDNPFYCGVIRMQRSGQTFNGLHAPIVPAALFQRVQDVLHGKAVGKARKHDWRYRRSIHCGLCERTLSGERQKGRVYYRCHTRDCPTKGIREAAVEDALRALYATVELSPVEVAEVRACFNHQRADATRARDEARKGVMLRISETKARMTRLTDALIDGVLDRAAHDERREGLLIEIARLEAQLEGDSDEESRHLEEMFELASSLVSSHDSASDEQKRRLVEITTSNFSLSGKNLVITLSEPFLSLSKRHAVQLGGPQRDAGRTTEMCHVTKPIPSLAKEVCGADKTNKRLTQ